MAIEIEHKFLLQDESWRDQIQSQCEYRQGYLISGGKSSVRVRVAGEKAYLNIKSRTLGTSRSEYEYAIPLDDAEQILAGLIEGPLIEKTRYLVPHEGNIWEIDQFHGDNVGLIVAEIELQAEGEVFVRPPWIGEEVSDDERYYNAALVKNPYKNWAQQSG